jgi:cellulose synthase/poly-beta-1,6-N-acetylglucosamine synthase-like glycosyltransferase
VNVLLTLAVALPLGFVTLCLAYLYLLALASVKNPRLKSTTRPTRRFAVAIPAHDEAGTIGHTLDQLRRQDYPAELFDIFVVCDNCTDDTVPEVRAHGGIALERTDNERRGKGYALAWLYERILAAPQAYQAIVVFDADSRVDPGFLKVMDAALAAGHRVAQGKHVIANPDAGWFPAVMFTAFAMDNRLRNRGRSNLRLSSKLMGDGMCFARDVLETHPWQAASLTEDAEYQSTLLLNGIRVAFVPQAITYGEIVTDLSVARRQRSRWMHGRADVAQRLASYLLRSGLRHKDLAQIDGAIERTMPSFSTLLVLTALLTALWAVLPGVADRLPWLWLVSLWVGFVAYPLLALAMERAPFKLYLYLAFAPIYALWRTGLRLLVRFQPRQVKWFRTPRSNGTK